MNFDKHFSRSGLINDKFSIEMRKSYVNLNQNPYPVNLFKFIQIFNHLRLCLATAIHNLKWLKNYPYLFNLRSNIDQILMFKHSFHTHRLIKRINNDNSGDQQDMCYIYMVSNMFYSKGNIIEFD